MNEFGIKESLYTIKDYKNEDHFIWDDFVKVSKNGTFLFQRGFMDYHSDRYNDFSLLIYSNNNLVGLFPANQTGNQIFSHQGLTYGGLILKNSIGGKKVRQILLEIVGYYKKRGIDSINVKSIPVFYHNRSSREFEYFLSDLGAIVYKRDLNLAIDYSLPLNINKNNKLRNFNKRIDLGFQIEEVDDLVPFWNQVLIPRLKEKHNSKPVHSIGEITLLKNKFPDQIKQFVISLEGRLLAGITIFITKQVIKSQYIAINKEGEKNRALDFLFITLINKYKEEGFRFFDFGTVVENNFGLLQQKEQLGCDIFIQDFYRLELK